MSNHDQNKYYENLASLVEADSLEINLDNLQRGEKLGRDLILSLTGSKNEKEALAMFSPGRPRVGHERGVSSSIRDRVPQEIKESLSSLAKREKKNESEIVRLAVVEYLNTHAA